MKKLTAAFLVGVLAFLGYVFRRLLCRFALIAAGERAKAHRCG